VKLLLDENLSPKLVGYLTYEFPGSSHVELLGMRGHSDAEIWKLAKRDGYVLVSKDDDFRQRSFVYGAPPKVIWLSVGNAGTFAVRQLIMAEVAHIEAFVADSEESLLVLDLPKQR
jgi:predicted nuclease of predicted toxin-antitoxin system